MKFITRNITAAAAALVTLICATPRLQAADLTLDGSGYYEFGRRISHSTEGVRQSGRYYNLTGAYYHQAKYGMDWITNNSRSRSGKLSFELWGMPYYGATKGIVVMTQGIRVLSGGHYHADMWVKGNAVFLDEYRFPEINLWEYTKYGWRFRDALSFKRDNLL